MSKYFLLTLLCARILSAGTSAAITSISIETKQNGYMVTLSSTAPVAPENLTSWYAPATGWFYISILHASADSAQLSSKDTKFPIMEIQASTEDSSAQIAIKSARYIEQSEFYYSDEPPEVLASLRFPVMDLISEKDEGDLIVSDKKPVSRNVMLLRKGLYFAGVSMTVAGIIDQDHDEGSGWELPAGAGIILGTWIWEKFGD